MCGPAGTIGLLSAEHVSHGIEQEVVEQRLLEDGTQAEPGDLRCQWRVDPADQQDDGQARTASLAGTATAPARPGPGG